MILLNLLITLASFAFMEGMAWITHKYVMHGFLWALHKDHHRKTSSGFFEHNDFFFLVFAVPGMVSLYEGMNRDYNYLFWIGTGITIYGFIYFLVHDVFIHQRFRWLRHTDNRYFRAIRRAHKMHHKHLGREHGECFGMLWVPARYFSGSNKD